MSKKGPKANFIFKIYVFQEFEMPRDVTVAELYDAAKLRLLRFYLAKHDRASSEDPESLDQSIEQYKDCYITSVTHS